MVQFQNLDCFRSCGFSLRASRLKALIAKDTKDSAGRKGVALHHYPAFLVLSGNWRNRSKPEFCWIFHKRLSRRKLNSNFNKWATSAWGALSAASSCHRLHKIRSVACGVAALDCIQSRYDSAFFIDSKIRKSKTIIVL